MEIAVKTKRIGNERGGCMSAPRGLIEIRGERFRQPCNVAACRSCAPLRQALEAAQTRNLVMTLQRERRRILSGVRKR